MAHQLPLGARRRVVLYAPTEQTLAHANRFAVTHPRWEPYAGKPHVRFCAGALSNRRSYRVGDSSGENGSHQPLSCRKTASGL
jgi:hypothetical protein